MFDKGIPKLKCIDNHENTANPSQISNIVGKNVLIYFLWMLIVILFFLIMWTPLGIRYPHLALFSLEINKEQLVYYMNTLNWWAPLKIPQPHILNIKLVIFLCHKILFRFFIHNIYDTAVFAKHISLLRKVEKLSIPATPDYPHHMRVGCRLDATILWDRALIQSFPLGKVET